MKLDLTRFRRASGHVDRRFPPTEVVTPGDDAYRAVAPVELAFDVHRDKNRFRLDGTVRTVLELACDRCLELFRLVVDTEFDLQYLPQSEESVGSDQKLADEDVDTNYYRDYEIDLTDLLQEQFYLALPMKPLCQDVCLGLCSHCGTNLNHKTCGCVETWEDPRLTPLRGFGRTKDA
jgi:uncharacterized protein